MQQLSGVVALEGVITIGTTNYGDDIDPALKRSQRLGLHFDFNPLLYPERFNLLGVLFKGRIDSTVDLAKIASLADQFTGADLQMLSQMSFDEAYKRSRSSGIDLSQVKINAVDIDTAFKLYKKLKFKI